MKIQSLVRLLLAIISGCLLSMHSYADQCALTYPDGLTNSTSSGSIKFTNYGRLINNTDTVLASPLVTNNGFATTCTSANCSASGIPVPELSGSFIYRSSNSNLTVNGYSTTISNNDYKDVKVKGGGTLTMNSNYSTYTFKKLKVENYSTVNFRPGDYYIEDLEIKTNSVLNVIGSGTVRIYTRTKATFKDSSVINGGSNGDASKLFLYHFTSGGSKIKVESRAKVTAFMYSTGQVEVKGVSDVYGGISAQGEIHIKNDGWVTYQASAVANTDFGSACSSGAAVVDHYEITHDASGSTCSAESITIKACKNADCSQLSTDVVSLDFTTDGTVRNSPTFTGSTTFDFTHSTAETLTLAVNNTSITPTNSLVCKDGSGSSCDIVFSSAGCSSGNTCATTFSDAATNSTSSGSINFENWGRLTYNPDTVLASKNVTHNNSIFTTCGTGNCTASGTIVPQLTGNFVANTSSNNLTVETQIHTITSNDYQDVNVKTGGFLYMNSGYSTYRFKKLTIEYLSRVYLTPGDYYIDELEVKGGSWLVTSGSGTVRIFVKTKAIFKELSSINGGLFGDASKLFLYYMNSGDKIQIESAASVAGFVYSRGGIEMTNYAAIYGAASAEGLIDIKEIATIVYRGTALENTDFGGACSSSGPSVHHYQFEYDPGGLTCQAQTVNIKACANESCSELYTSPSTMTLTATTPEPSSTSTNLEFTGSHSIQLGESLPTTVSLGMSASSPSADLKCYENGGLDANCDYTLKDTGFIFLNTTDNSQSIPTQISGKPSNTGYNSRTIALQAVQNDVNTGACTALFADNAVVSIDLAYQCEDPGSCVGDDDNVATLTNDGNLHKLKKNGTYDSYNLKFGANSKAEVVLNYPDAGKIKLHARKSIVLPQNETTVMIGSSNSIVVRPFGFYMNMGANPGSTNNSGSVFKRAGERFDLTLSAIAWQAGEDETGPGGVPDGKPDSGVRLSDNPITLNFGLEATKEQATITTALVSPAIGDDPGLTNNSFAAFVSGSKTNNVSWDDVGVVSFAAAGDGNYLGSGDNIETVIPHVGRFVPDHFSLVNAALNQACGDFSYMGQPVNVGFELRARGVGGIVLNNYDGGNGNDVHGLASVALVAENSNSGTDLGGRFSNIDFAAAQLRWNNGVIAGAIVSDFARLPVNQGMDGPYDNLFAGLRVLDGDAHAVIGFSGAQPNMNAATSDNCVERSNCDAIALNAQEVQFRYGRLSSKAAFGPATTAITSPIQTEYWDSNSFALSSTDSCTTLQASEIDMSGVHSSPFATTYEVKDITSHEAVGTISVDTSEPGTTATRIQAADGYFFLTLNPPTFSVGNTGYVPVTINATNYPWLQFDWDTYGQGAVDTYLPTQNVTFGQFRGNDRVIYWREKL